MKAFLCVNLKRSRNADVFPKVVESLKTCGITVLLDDELEGAAGSAGCELASVSDNCRACDIFVTIGGDGTILRWGKLAAFAGKPLLGINTGRLGFMATLECDELEKLSRLCENKYAVSRRMMADVKLLRDGDETTFTALNDVVLFKASKSKLPEYSVSSNGNEVSRIRADGLIISTPTGSTAYSLSAGGPIIDPAADCFELTALCPHTLFSRPMIFPGGSVIRAGYRGYESSSVFLTVDGNEDVELNESDYLEVTKSEMHLDLIDLNESNSFYDSINNKLMKPLK